MTNILEENFIDDLVRLRKALHQKAELSENEVLTPGLELDFLRRDGAKSVISEVGGNGLLIIYDSGKPGPVTVFRCELDALPIQEINTFSHRSANKGVSHKCGHDGHMAIVTGLGKLLEANPPQKGKVVLLYQPAEETGTGAVAVLKDERFLSLKPDFMYALHNLPQLEKYTIFIKNGPFAAASRGIIIKLYGATSHAAEPENGRSPAMAVSKIIKALSTIPTNTHFKDFTTITVVHALLGEIAFGVTPGYAEIRATLRTFLDEDMAHLIAIVTSSIRHLASEEGLEYDISFTEVFPATYNAADAVNIVANAAKAANLKLEVSNEPFKWSEDFGHFLHQYRGALFGLGAGEDTPALHNNDYDFPDELIPTGVQLFYNIAHYHNF